LSETVLIANPEDLTITHFKMNDIPDTTIGNTTYATFWLTPCVLFPQKSIEYRYTGDIKADDIDKFEFTLNSVKFEISEHFKYIDQENGDVVIINEPVAVCEALTDSFDIDSILSSLDDFLLIVSFAARQRCICVGWNISDSKTHTEFYRRNLTMPEVNRKHCRFYDVLIDVAVFKDFVKFAYSKYNDLVKQQYVKNALYCALNQNKGTVESSFKNLFAAIESLIFGFSNSDRESNLILSQDKWKDFEKVLRQYIKKGSILGSDEHKKDRKNIYEKIGELNRISFSTAFRKFREIYPVELTDLWPLLDGVCQAEHTSLSSIRNRLVHGQIFDKSQFVALSIAKHHLAWTLERMILSILSWPIEKSKVDKQSLKIWTDYENWQTEHERLAKNTNYS